MSAREAKAERCLVAVCAHLCMLSIKDEDFELWRDVLREVLLDCGNCVLALVSLRSAARVLVSASPGRDLQAAESRLRFEVREYYRVASSQLYESWNDLRLARGHERVGLQ